MCSYVQHASYIIHSQVFYFGYVQKNGLALCSINHQPLVFESLVTGGPIRPPPKDKVLGAQHYSEAVRQPEFPVPFAKVANVSRASLAKTSHLIRGEGSQGKPGHRQAQSLGGGVMPPPPTSPELLYEGSIALRGRMVAWLLALPMANSPG